MTLPDDYEPPSWRNPIDEADERECELADRAELGPRTSKLEVLKRELERKAMPDLEPARALAARPPNARSRAEDIIRLVYDLEGSPCATEKEVAELLEADRAAIREQTLREAIERLEIMAGSPLATGEQEQGLRMGAERLRKLLTGGKTHG